LTPGYFTVAYEDYAALELLPKLLRVYARLETLPVSLCMPQFCQSQATGPAIDTVMLAARYRVPRL